MNLTNLMTFIDYATKILKDHNQKITSTRLWLLEQLANTTTPCNPYDIVEKNPDAQIDITTIYRNFELFESLGLIHKISSLGGYIACHHQHDCISHDLIICRDCNSIEETHIHTETKKLLGLSAGPVELNGRCEKCEGVLG